MHVSNWKIILLAVVLVIVLFLLYPRRQVVSSTADAADITEISFITQDSAVWDALRAFERMSADRHAADPSKPRYRVISGQTAARDQTSDPTRFLVATAGGAPPDVIVFDRFAVTEWAARNAFLPLDDFIARDVANKQKNPPPPTQDLFYQACWDEAMYQGKVYGIPQGVDDRALVYNKDLLVRAGLVDEKGEAKPPKTWEELREYSKKLTERDANGAITRIGFIPNYGNSWLYIYGWMNGGEFMSKDGATCTLNDPKIVEALQYMRTLYDDLGGYQAVQAFQAGFQGGELDPFIQGNIAMKIDGVWVLGNIAKYAKELPFGVAPPPMPAARIAELEKQGEKPLISWAGGWAYCIPATARQKEGAWELIRFLTSERAVSIIDESKRALAESQGRLFVPGQQPQKALNERAYQRYILGNPNLPESFSEGAKTFNDLLTYSRFRPVTPVGQRLWNEHVSAMENAMYPSPGGHPTPQEALDTGTRVVQREVDKFYKPSQGVTINNWHLFFIIYPLLLLAVGFIAYRWDTHLGVRRWISRLLRLPDKVAEDVIPGARGSYFRHQWWEGLLCVSPWLLGFIVFGGGPMLFSIIISFTRYDILNRPIFTGFENYVVMFTEDSKFWPALGNTAFMLIAVPVGMAVSLGVAILLNQKIRVMAFWRTLFYLPAIVPMVAASILWVWIFNPSGGFINQALSWLHLQDPLMNLLHLIGIGGSKPMWLQDPALSKPSLIIMGLWGAGASMIIWLAGLKSIPAELYEAASVDGATGWQQFWKITIPQLSPYIFFNLVMGCIGTFQIFGQAFIMTQGGPKDSTLFYVYHLFNNAFRYGQMGYASAMAWVLFIIILAVTIFQVRYSSRWVYYESE